MTTMATTRRSRSWFWRDEEPEWTVVALVVLALLVGAILAFALRGQSRTVTAEAVTVSFPASWSSMASGAASAEGALISAGEMTGRAALSLTVLRELDPANPVSMDTLVAQRTFDRAQVETMYRVLSSASADVGGKRAVAVSFAYVAEPRTTAYQSALPVVMEGVDYILAHEGKVYVLTLEAPADEFESRSATFERIVQSVRL